jgi:AcrR family transcriptional regulator
MFHPSDTTTRILDAALTSAETFGIRRTTMEDVARVAGVSRITVYRHFESKDVLISNVVLRETQSFFGALTAAIDGYESIEDRLAEGFAFTLDYLQNHSLLNRLLEIEPDSVLPYLTTAGGPLLATARGHLGAILGEDVSAGRIPPFDVEVIAEILTRLCLSFLLAPETAIDLKGPEDARRFARRFLVPILQERVVT